MLRESKGERVKIQYKIYFIYLSSILESASLATNIYQGRPIGPAGYTITNGLPRSDVPAYASIPIVTSAPPNYVNTIAPGKMAMPPPPGPQSKY